MYTHLNRADTVVDMHRRASLATLTGLALMVSGVSGAWGQDKYPSRPVSMIVAYPAGGPVDGAARQLAEALQRQLGQPFVINYKTGASGAIGHAANATAAPDGYTLLFAASPPQTMLPHSQKLLFDPLRDYTPIGSFAESQFALVTSGTYAPNTVAEVIADAKARPGKVNFASSGVGSLTHMASEVFKQKANIDVVHIPYKGGGEALSDLLNGTVQFMTVPVTGAHRAQAKAGKLKVLAVAADARSKTLPDVPTFIEAGVPDFLISTWYALEGPPGLPPAVSQTLRGAVLKLPQDSEFIKAMNQLDIDVRVLGAADLQKRIEKEYQLWGATLKNK